MPSYDYKCKNESCEKHDEIKEIIKSMKDPAPSCEVCNEVMEQRLGNGNFTLKGAGWFKHGGY